MNVLMSLYFSIYWRNLESQKSLNKLKSKFANISSESLIAGFANIFSHNKFQLYGSQASYKLIAGTREY